MLQVFLNDVPQKFHSTPSTWGDLLDTLDEQAANDGVVLSAARFDGVDQPSFRDPHVTGRTLSSVTRVDVETAVPTAFLRECLLDAIEGLEEAAKAAQMFGALYRGHDLSAGHEGLARLSADLQSLTMLVGVLEGPLQIDLSKISTDGVTASEEVHQLGAIVDSLVAAQESVDWLTVADVLEYDLEPAIRRWVKVLSVIAQSLE
jgi:hypothetical protein